MIIGNFTYDARTDRYRGQIRTLSLSCDVVEFRPQTRGNDREPDYRVTMVAPEGDIELGAAWQRRTDRGCQYLSVLLDDPSLERALSAALFTDKDGKANLVWSRPVLREVAPPQDTPPRRGRQKPAVREPTQG